VIGKNAVQMNREEIINAPEGLKVGNK